MIPWFATLSLANKAIAVAVALALIASILGGAYWWAYSRGHEAGYGDGQRSQLDIDRKAFEQERATFLEKLNKYQEQDDAAKQKIAATETQLAQLQSRRNAQRNAVQSLPDASLIPNIHSQLGRPDEPNSPSASALSSSDLREIALRLSDLQSLQESVTLLEAKSAAQDERVAALEKQRDAAVLYGNEVTKHYAMAYAAAQKKPFWLWRIFGYKGKRIDLPAPVSLHP